MNRQTLMKTALGQAILWSLLLSPAIRQHAYADGCYIPEKAVQKMPAIPLQRAILVYKDQTEKLIIESTLSAEGQRFGWIIPVPAKPTEIQEVSPGLINTLAVQTSPTITHDLFGAFSLILVPAVVVSLWLLAELLQKPTEQRKPVAVFLRFSLCLMLVLMICSLFLPSLGTASTPIAQRALPGVHVEDAQVVGNYEVTLLQADSAEGLNQWLDQNGFAPLPSEGNAIVTDYIRQNWHFVAAKLQRDGQGPAKPHPLSITFASINAIYPMRLTALAQSPVALDLFAVSQQQAAETWLLSIEFSDVLRKPVAAESKETPRTAGYAGEGTRTVVNHPQPQGTLWDGCCLTRLTGVIQPENMDSDIQLNWQQPSSYRPHLYSRRGAWTIGLLVMLAVWTFGMPVALHIAVRRVPAGVPGWRWFRLKRAVGPSLLACVVCGLATYLALPKTDVQTFSGLAPRMSFNSYRDGWIHPNLRDKMHATPSLSLAEFRQLYVESMGHYWGVDTPMNHITGERIRDEDSPGNYTIREDAGHFVVTWYDAEMNAKEVILPEPTKVADR